MKTKQGRETEELDVGHQLSAPHSGEGPAPRQRTETERTEIEEDTAALPIELARVTSERDALLERIARIQAEFENARKRSAKQQQESKDFALEAALKSLLSVLDSFDRALHIPVRNLEEFRSGVALIRKQLQDVLGKMGLRQIHAKGEPFDPQLHEAVAITESVDARGDQVLDELQHGYQLRDRLLRPAMVRVGRPPQNK